MKTITVNQKDILAFAAVASVQATVAWIMYLFNLVYAPLPMFAAALIGGWLMKGSPRTASLIGAVAGLVGGTVAEVAYHFVRIEQMVTWIQLNAIEHFWLAVAETILYASLLSFFMAFFSWGTYRESSNSKIPVKNPVMTDDPAASINVPMFKEPEVDDDQINDESY